MVDVLDWSFKLIPLIISLAVAAGAIVFAFRLGQERNGWRIEYLEKEVEVLKELLKHEADRREKAVDTLRLSHHERISMVEAKTSSFDVALGIIQASLGQIKDSISDLSKRLDTKQNKE